MASVLKRWYLDVPDTRDWDLASVAKSSQIRKGNQSQPRPHRRIEAKILSQIRRFRNSEHSSLPSVLEADYESILPRFGNANYPVESAVIWALTLKSGQPACVRPGCFSSLSRQSQKQFGIEDRANSIRDILKTLIRIDADQRCFGRDCEIADCIFGNGKPDNPDWFPRIRYFRLDRPFDSRKNKRLFRWVLACIAAKLPVLFTAPLMNISFTSTKEIDSEVIASQDLVYPIGQHPLVGFDSVECVEKIQKIDTQFIRKFGPNKTTSRLISDTALGIRSRNFVGDALGCSDFTIIPEWYFHLGLVRDCWVVIKSNEKYLDDAF